MRAQEGVTDTPIPVEDPDLREAIVPSATTSAASRAPVETSALAALVVAHLEDALRRGLARGTVAYRRVYLAQLLAWLLERGITTAHRVTPGVLAAYMAHLRGRLTDYNRETPSPLSVKTLSAEASVVRSFFAWLTTRRVLLFNPAEALRLTDRTEPLPKPVLTESEVRALLAAPGAGTLGLRDRAILETLYSTGLRRAELCALDLYDLDQGGELVRVRCGKGGRDRVVPIGSCALAAVRRYLREARPELVATPKEPALFLAAVTRRRLGVKTLNLIVRRHAEAAGLAKRVTPHVLRHTCATHLLRGGADIRHVQLILGHASVATTQIYTRVAVEDLVTVHRRSHPRRRLKVLEHGAPAGVSSP
jgi:integrase/recombinase XerD